VESFGQPQTRKSTLEAMHKACSEGFPVILDACSAAIWAIVEVMTDIWHFRHPANYQLTNVAFSLSL
jgi:hypothetical protein